MQPQLSRTRALGARVLLEAGVALLGAAALLIPLLGCGGGGGSGGGGGGTGSSQSALIDACGEDIRILRPLVGEGPAWYTPEVRQRAIEARELGLGYDFEARQFVAPAAAPSQVLLRPGTQIFPDFIFPGWCTAAFVMGNRQRIATAGHCTRANDMVLALTAPTTIFAIGKTTASVDGGPGNDWAHITIDEVWRPFTAPDVAFVGGPCGMTSAGGLLPRPLKLVGHGAVLGTGGTPRTGLLQSLRGGCFTATAPVSGGDSGCPMLDVVPTTQNAATLCAGGQAIGILTHEATLFGLLPTTIVVGTPIWVFGGGLDDGEILP